MVGRIGKGYLLSASALALCLAANQAGAQTTPAPDTSKPSSANADDNSNNGDIVVTASKRAEKLRDVPSAITVLSGDTVDKLGIQSIRDYATLTPGLTVADDGTPGSGKVFIRGLQTGTLQQSATTVFYLDDVPFTASSSNGGGAFVAPDPELVDLDRIEVLKGPQGTLYGASSLGGVIRLISKRPDPSGFSGSARAEVSAVDGGGIGYLVNGSLNVPLVKDRLALRTTAFYRRAPGFVDNVGTNTENVNWSDSKGFRVALGWTPSSRFTLDLVGQYQDTDTNGLALEDDVTGTFKPLLGKRKYSQFFNAPNTVRYRLVSATGKYETGIGQLIGTVSYAEARLHTENDFTAFYGPQLPVLAFFGYNYPANTGVAYQSTIPQKKKSAELRFVSNRLGPVEFILGGFYTNERVAPLTTDIVTRNTTTNTELPAPLGSLIASPIRDRYEELSGFGNVTFYLTNNFDITGGVRYAHYTEKFSLNYTGVFYSPPLGAPQTLGLDASEDHASYLATVRWRPTSTLSVFARAASGFRPGGPQPAVNPPAGAQRLIKPDTVWNYEAGIKGDFLNKTLSLEASVYRIDWKNIQLYTIFQNQVVLANAGQARVEGFEFAALARPTNLLSIGVNAGYTNPRITKIDPGVSSVIGAAVGDTIPQTPHWTVSATADQSIPLGGNVQGQLGATMRFQSEMYTSYPSSVTAPNVKLPSITTVDLRAGLSFGSYQLQLRVENVLNERGLINYAPGSPGVPATANISRPRTFSLAVSTKF